MTPSAQLAELLVDRLGVDGPPNLDEIAAAIGLRIKEVDSDGFEGALVRDAESQKGIVLVKAKTRERSRKRFTIAHEIGHYMIPTHIDNENVCLAKELESWSESLATPELEANEFAAELLLPNKLVASRFPKAEPSLQHIAAIAQEFQTSLTATTRRFIDITDLSCAMVWTQQEWKWVRRSENFKAFIPLDEIPYDQSFAGQLLAGRSVPDVATPVNPILWLNERDVTRVERLLEHSIYLKNYKAVLTLLWIQS